MSVYHWSRVTTGKTKSLEKIPKDAFIDYVDDKVCLGRCETCGVPVAESDNYWSDEEGTPLCEKCSPREAEATP